MRRRLCKIAQVHCPVPQGLAKDPVEYSLIFGSEQESGTNPGFIEFPSWPLLGPSLARNAATWISANVGGRSGLSSYGDGRQANRHAPTASLQAQQAERE